MPYKMPPTVLRRRCDYCHELPEKLVIVQDELITYGIRMFSKPTTVFYVECPVCKTRGPRCSSPTEAAWAWNAPDKPTSDETRWWPGKRV